MPGVGVERGHQLPQRVVAVGLAERHGVLDLLQADDVGVHGVDRPDDLVLLAGQVGVVRRRGDRLGVQVVDRDRVAGAVVEGACRRPGCSDVPRLTGGVEVVQHVEGRELEVAAHGRRRGAGAGVGEGRHGVAGRRSPGLRLELPDVVAEVQDQRPSVSVAAAPTRTGVVAPTRPGCSRRWRCPATARPYRSRRPGAAKFSDGTVVEGHRAGGVVGGDRVRPPGCRARPRRSAGAAAWCRWPGRSRRRCWC